LHDDVCTAGVPSNPIVTDRSCNGTEFCKSDGTCHQCNTDAQCGSANDTFCLKHTCVNNSCTIASSPTAGTLLPMANQALHDCIDQVCDGNGGVTTQLNGNDTPVSTPCNTGTCNGATPTQTPIPLTMPPTACGGGTCDGMGACVGCLANADCGLDTECKHFICNKAIAGGTCETHPVADGTPLASQMAGDCKLVVCDGNGLSKSNVDITDVPVDNNTCTDDKCSADGMPSNPIIVDRACMANGVCSGTGTCVGCNTDAQCDSAHNTECRKNTCLNNTAALPPVRNWERRSLLRRQAIARPSSATAWGAPRLRSLFWTCLTITKPAPLTAAMPMARLQIHLTALGSCVSKTAGGGATAAEPA